MSIPLAHRFAGFAIALLIHLLLAFWLVRQAPVHGAAAAGEGGVSVGLGMAGAYADAAEVKPAEAAPAAVIKAVAPLPVEPLEETVASEVIPPEPVVEAEVEAEALTAEPRQMVAADIVTEPLEKRDTLLEQPVAAVAAPKAAAPVAVASTEPPAKKVSASKSMKKASGSAYARHSGGRAGDVQGYFAELMAWLNQHKDYPAALKKNKQQGTAIVKFTINRAGQLLSAKIKTSSGIAALDRAALGVLERANPLPAIPEFMQRQRLTLAIPVDYSLRTK